MLKLDDRDLKIIAILREEGRISKADLARRVNLSAAPCWERLQRLEKACIIITVAPVPFRRGKAGLGCKGSRRDMEAFTDLKYGCREIG